MTEKKVDIEKSLKKGKIYFSENPIFGLIDNIVWIAILTFFFAITLKPIFINIENIKKLTVFAPLAIIGILAILLIYKLLNMGKLKTIKGIEDSKNREICKKIVEEKWKKRIDNKKMIYANVKDYGNIFGGQDDLVIFFHNNLIRYRFISYSWLGGQIPMSFIRKPKFSKEFENEINEIIKNVG